MASQVKDAAWLAWIERLAGVSARCQSDELPRSLFHCRLGDQPDHLVPERLLRPWHWEVPSDRPLLLNPGCIFTRGEESPAAISPEGFAMQGEMVWITDPATAAVQPFWLGREFSTTLSGAKPGDPAPSILARHARRILIAANVLVPEDYAASRRKQWDEIVFAGGNQFRERGYAPLGRLIHPFHIAALRRYYRHQIRSGRLRLGDGQCPSRYVAHNEPVARFFHHQLTAAVTAIVGEPVKPSYVYLASYQQGAVLKQHTDREQCEFSLTLCLDYSPEPRNATPWPLLLHAKSGDVKVFQAIGDALLYRGRELPHSRDPLPQEHTSTSIFFHYVRKDFTGSLD